MNAYPNIVKLVSGEKKATDSGQLSMFQTINQQVSFDIPEFPEYDHEYKLKLEKEVVGIYLSGHPLSSYSDLFEQFKFNTSKIRQLDDEHESDGENDEAEEYGNDSKVIFGAIITSMKKMLTKSTKAEMCVIRVEDLYGSIEVMLFPKIYTKYREIIKKDAVVRITGRISYRENEAAIILAEEIAPLENIPDAPIVASGRCLILKYNSRDENVNTEVQKILNAYKGEIPVQINCTGTNKPTISPYHVRECTSIKVELGSLIGNENILFR